MTWLHWKQFFLPEWRTTPAFRVLASSAWQLEINMLLPLIGRTTQRCQEPWKIWDGIQQLMNVMIKRSAEYLTVMGSGQFFEETTLSFPFSWYFKNGKLHTPDTGGETSHFHSLCPLRSTDEGNCSNYFLQVLDCGFLSSERIEGLPVPSKSRPVALRLRVQLLPFLLKSKAPPVVTRWELLGQQRVYPEAVKKGEKARKQVVNGSRSLRRSLKWVTCDHEWAGGAEVVDADAHAVHLHPDYDTHLISLSWLHGLFWILFWRAEVSLLWVWRCRSGKEMRRRI